MARVLSLPQSLTFLLSSNPAASANLAPPHQLSQSPSPSGRHCSSPSRRTPAAARPGASTVCRGQREGSGGDGEGRWRRRRPARWCREREGAGGHAPRGSWRWRRQRAAAEQGGATGARWASPSSTSRLLSPAHEAGRSNGASPFRPRGWRRGVCHLRRSQSRLGSRQLRRHARRNASVRRGLDGWRRRDPTLVEVGYIWILPFLFPCTRCSSI